MNIKQLSTMLIFLGTMSPLSSASQEEDNSFNLMGDIFAEIELEEIKKESSRALAQPIAVLSEAEQEMLDRDLSHATSAKDFLKVKEAVAAGANVKNQDPFGRIPLHYAVFSPVITAFLITKDQSSINIQDGRDNTPLLSRIEYLYRRPWLVEVAESARMLLNTGADPRISGYGKKIALHYAAGIEDERANALFFEILSKAPELINKQDEYGHTPLSYAIASKNRYAVNALMAAGARTDIRNRKDKTARDIAQEEGILDWLPAHGAQTKPAARRN